jgi:hypothetical protein
MGLLYSLRMMGFKSNQGRQFADVDTATTWWDLEVKNVPNSCIFEWFLLL